MKKKILILLALSIILFTLSACGNKSDATTTISESIANATSTTQTQTTKSAVIYFSATGTTKGVAEVLAKETDSDLLEIEPLNPYKTEDLTYSKECRANAEQKDKTVRPEIQNDLSVAKDYDVIYLGYPIWWGTNPRIIQTFLDKYDLSGAKIYLFCTSGGSGIETSVNDIKSQYPSLNIVDSKRFSSAEKNEIDQWLNK